MTATSVSQAKGWWRHKLGPTRSRLHGFYCAYMCVGSHPSAHNDDFWLGYREGTEAKRALDAGFTP